MQRAVRTVGQLWLVTWTLFAVTTTAKAEEICFRVQGGCRPASALSNLGIAYVKFQPNGFLRDDTSAAWKIIGYREDHHAVQLPILAVLSERPTGENEALTSQEDVCNALFDADIGCTRDYLSGTWFTYGIGERRPFSAEFINYFSQDLAGGGQVTTKRWACQKDGLEVEIACTGRYFTSYRLLYLTNRSDIQFREMECSETGETRAAQADIATLPACASDGNYDSLTWLPFEVPFVTFTAANAERVWLDGVQISLYFQGWQP